jgi:hypothetical protein
MRNSVVVAVGSGTEAFACVAIFGRVGVARVGNGDGEGGGFHRSMIIEPMIGATPYSDIAGVGNRELRAEVHVVGIKVTITRYLSDEPQPGIVECQLVDARSRVWLFVEKSAIVSADVLHARSPYPQPGVIAGEVVERCRNPDGREVVRINTEQPYGVCSVDGAVLFDVFAESLEEIDGQT